ncbi:unnamed protein product, partial [Durusdinium trenchii]
YDGVTHGYIGKDATSNRSLQSLTCRILLCQKACLELLMNFMEGCIYDLEYWSCLTSLVKNRRSSSEYLEAPQLSEEINGVKELLYQEAKDKKAQLKKNDEDITEVVMAVPEEGEVEEDEDDTIKTTFGHMVIGETEKPELPFKKNAEGTEMAKLNDKLLNLKKIAQRKVATNIKFIIEPNSENELVDLYMDTFLKDFSGEWRVRFTDNCDGAPVFNPCDIVMINDGGRGGGLWQWMAKLLTERVEKLTFQAMQNPKSPLFTNELMKVIRDSKKGSCSSVWKFQLIINPCKDNKDEKPKDPKTKKEKGNRAPKEEEKHEEEEDEEEGEDLESPAESGLPKAEEEELEDEGCGDKTPEWINTEGEETSPPSDMENHEITKLKEEADAMEGGKKPRKPRGKAAAKAKAKAQEKEAKAQEKEAKAQEKEAKAQEKEAKAEAKAEAKEAKAKEKEQKAQEKEQKAQEKAAAKAKAKESKKRKEHPESIRR